MEKVTGAGGGQPINDTKQILHGTQPSQQHRLIAERDPWTSNCTQTTAKNNRTDVSLSHGSPLEHKLIFHNINENSSVVQQQKESTKGKKKHDCM